MLKPSEYIKLGCELRPKQCVNVPFKGDDESCVVGAFVHGFSGQDSNFAGNACNLLRAMRWLDERKPVHCPECGWDDARLWEAAVHLNNLHGWTRERIGEWLDSQMPAPRWTPVEEEEELAVIA